MVLEILLLLGSLGAGHFSARRVALFSLKCQRYGVQLSVSGISTSTIGFVLFDVAWNGSTCYGCNPFWGYFLAIVGGTIFSCGVAMLVNGLFLKWSSLTRATLGKWSMSSATGSYK